MIEFYVNGIKVSSSSTATGFVSVEHDKALKETDNAIEPKHYREGQIDLIESWYLRYPFNEFKTGMVMYADRYFNRSKNNRVEDMEKGLYVMQRLKEYEEKEKEKENDSDY